MSAVLTNNRDTPCSVGHTEIPGFLTCIYRYDIIYI